jgi:hypothetical protein
MCGSTEGRCSSSQIGVSCFADSNITRIAIRHPFYNFLFCACWDAVDLIAGRLSFKVVGADRDDTNVQVVVKAPS